MSICHSYYFVLGLGLLVLTSKTSEFESIISGLQLSEFGAKGHIDLVQIRVGKLKKSLVWCQPQDIPTQSLKITQKTLIFATFIFQKSRLKSKFTMEFWRFLAPKFKYKKGKKIKHKKGKKIQMRHFSSIFKHCGNNQFWLTLDITSSQKHLSMTSQDSRKDSSCRQMSHDLFNAYFLFLKRISLPHFQTHAVGKVLVIFSRKSSLPG